jgi:hypothetical protein
MGDRGRQVPHPSDPIGVRQLHLRLAVTPSSDELLSGRPRRQAPLGTTTCFSMRSKDRCGLFAITDNGIGLNDENFDSFNTAFSDHKLSRGGKGLRRFTWLKAFDKVEIDSTFEEQREDPQRRRFAVASGSFPLATAASAGDLKRTSCRRLILFAGTAHHDLECVIGHS